MLHGAAFFVREPKTSSWRLLPDKAVQWETKMISKILQSQVAPDEGELFDAAPSLDPERFLKSDDGKQVMSPTVEEDEVRP